MKDGPLREGALLLTGLGFLTIPLLFVTGQPKANRSQLVTVEASVDSWVADVEVISAHPFLWMELRKGEEVLGRLEGPVREGEFECEVAKKGELLVVAASYSEEIPETALQLKIWASSYPPNQFTFWGRGELVEEREVRFDE